MRNVGRLVKGAIDEYFKLNKVFPDLIIFYRGKLSKIFILFIFNIVNRWSFWWINENCVGIRSLIMS